MIIFLFVSRILILGILRFKFNRLGLVFRAIYDASRGEYLAPRKKYNNGSF